MSALYGFARAGSLAYVNNDQDDSVAPNRARPTRVMSGLRYAAEVAARLSPAGHGPTTPALYTQEGHPAPPLVNASASWLRHHASESSGATSPTSTAVRQSPSRVARRAVAVATPRGHSGGAGFSSSVVAGGHSLPPLEATASADALWVSLALFKTRWRRQRRPLLRRPPTRGVASMTTATTMSGTRKVTTRAPRALRQAPPCHSKWPPQADP